MTNRASLDRALDAITVCEWGADAWRERHVRIAPCPKAGAEERWTHELTVADAFDDEQPHVYCTCGWIGPAAETEEQAVAAHNKPHGLDIEPLSEWVVHKRMPTNDDAFDLPF